MFFFIGKMFALVFSLLGISSLLLSSSKKTSSSGGDETDLLTWWGISGDGSWVTDVLVVTSSVWMVDWVHGNTSNSWPHFSLGLESVMLGTGLQDWLIGSLSSSNESNGSSAVSSDGLSGTGWQSDSGLGSIFRVSNDSDGGSRGSGVGSLISDSLLDIVDNGTFWDRVDWQDVSDSNGSFISTVNVLSDIGSLGSQEVLSIGLELVWVSEADLSQWGTSTWVMDDFLDDSSDVSLSLSEVEVSVLWGSNSVVLM